MPNISSRHLLQLINDVLDLSKVEAGKLDFRPEPLDPQVLVSEVLSILRETAANKRIQIKAEFDPQLREIVLDPARLKQVLYNYLSNAIKFTPEMGHVTVRMLAQGDDDLLLEVQDTGEGLSESDIRRLFVEFQQLHRKGAARQGGTGLGLALTRQLVQAQGGRVGVRSVVGTGSTFFAQLPRVAPQGLQSQTLPRQRVAPTGARRVLVVEDDSRDRGELVKALSDAGYAVEVAATGAAAVAMGAKHVFDAITLDLLLPDMSGIDVLKQIRDQGLNRETAVVVVTLVTEPGVMAGFAVHDVLQKPIDNERLLDSLHTAGILPQQALPVLVTDDDPNALKLMATALHRLGFAAHCEVNPAVGLERALHEIHSAVVVDLLMPGMDGFEFLDRLHTAPDWQQVPVIVWTVKDLEAHETATLLASAQAVVNKGRGGTAAVVAELSAFLPALRAAE